MDVFDAIKTRRSVRKYKREPISKSDIIRIIEAGIWAPSGLNNQPWKFYIVDKNEDLKKLAKFTRYSRIIRESCVCICVFLDKTRMYNREKDIMAIGACIQNMLLQIHNMGLGACWLGEILNRKEDVRESLNVSKENELMAVISIGIPDEDKLEGKRQKIEDFILND